MKGTTSTKYEFQSDGFEKFPKPQYLLLDIKMFVSYRDILISFQQVKSKNFSDLLLRLDIF
jgi:hypothetical protein